MRKYIYILSFMTLLNLGCSSDHNTIDTNEHISIILHQDSFNKTRVIDADNLESEQIINNIAIFLTDPSSETITHKYINAGFSTIEDYRLVTLPLTPGEVMVKNIYVIVNYDDTDSLNYVNTLTDMRELMAPEVNKSNNLDPANGFCMFGKTLNFNFNTNQAASVTVKRVCAKLRINLSFPQDPDLSTNNSFLITHVASYAYVADDVTGKVFPTDAYFNFASELPLVRTETNSYVNLAYVYEASQPPVIYIYTNINNSAGRQEFSTNLPIPVRNHLYDIDIRIYEDTAVATTEKNVSDKIFKFESIITEYNEMGEKTEVTIN